MLGTAFIMTGNVFAAGPTIYSAALNGSQEVPPVTTDMTGTVFIKANGSGGISEYTLNVHKGDHVMAAHLHCGDMGKNGPVVAYLFGKGGNSDVSGELKVTSSSVSIEPSGAQCETPINTVADLVTAIDAGKVYANVHTKDNPNGEIRGQLSKVPVAPSLPPVPTSGDPGEMQSFIDQVKTQNQAFKTQLKSHILNFVGQLNNL